MSKIASYENITLPTDSVSLDGNRSSDPDGKISKWLWTKISGHGSFNIITQSDSISKVKALVVVTYQFELKVTDNGGLSTKDAVQVIVNDPSIPNRPPVANAGAECEWCFIQPGMETGVLKNKIQQPDFIVWSRKK